MNDMQSLSKLQFFFLNDPAPPEIYTLPLHDPLPISAGRGGAGEVTIPRAPAAVLVEPFLRLPVAFPPIAEEGLDPHEQALQAGPLPADDEFGRDRKSTRLNSSHSQISYAVFCLKKKT